MQKSSFSWPCRRTKIIPFCGPFNDDGVVLHDGVVAWDYVHDLVGHVHGHRACEEVRGVPVRVVLMVVVVSFFIAFKFENETVDLQRSSGSYRNLQNTANIYISVELFNRPVLAVKVGKAHKSWFWSPTTHRHIKINQKVNMH